MGAKISLYLAGRVKSFFSQAGLTALLFLIAFAMWRQPHKNVRPSRWDAQVQSAAVLVKKLRVTNKDYTTLTTARVKDVAWIFV